MVDVELPNKVGHLYRQSKNEKELSNFHDTVNK